MIENKGELFHNLYHKMVKKGLLERLQEGPVIGDGGYVFTLEKRGYVMAGPYTTEVVIEHPEAGGLGIEVSS